MEAGDAPRALDSDLRHALGAAVADEIGPALASPPGDDTVRRERHGTIVAWSAHEGGRRRVLELDRHGAALMALRWSRQVLVAAWLRVPDGSWLAIEPRAVGGAPWGRSDVVRRAGRPGAFGEPLTVFEAVDYAALDRIPTLAEPARLPSGAGGAILNLLAALARDQRRTTLAYRGPYPTEHLFLALLDCFRYTPASADPLAAFVAGALTWEPAPHERVFDRDGVYVQLRGGVETVVWRGRRYQRPDVQDVARHAPYRVRDHAGTVRCSLWALGAVLEDHLELSVEGDVLDVTAPAPAKGETTALPPAVGAAIAAAVAATSAPALSSFVREVTGSLVLEWAPLAGDLVDVGESRARLSTRWRERLATVLSQAADDAARAAAGFAALGELALLLGDALRVRAQDRVLALPAAEQEALLRDPPPAARDDDARTITSGVHALLRHVIA